MVSQPLQEVPSDNNEDEDFEENDFEDEQEQEKPVKVAEKTEKKQVTEEKLKMIDNKISMLQDNGIFRFELLAELKEIRTALTIIAGSLVGLTENGKNE